MTSLTTYLDATDESASRRVRIGEHEFLHLGFS